MSYYYWDLAFVWALRLIVLSSLGLFLVLGGCSSRGVQGTLNGTVVDPAIELGRSTGTRTGNQVPQGGSDEKSNSTPAKPSD